MDVELAVNQLGRCTYQEMLRTLIQGLRALATMSS